jgi:phosphoadenosine phosphosulfate reductase
LTLLESTLLETTKHVISDALAEFGRSLAVLTSFQREGVVILDIALQLEPDIRVMTIDTGRLPEATHQMIEHVERRFGIQVERIVPNPAEVRAMISRYGEDLFRAGVPQRMLCCNVRKVQPLAIATEGLGAYFTGVRRGQSESRANVEIFDRHSSPVRINALAEWTAANVAEYSASRSLPEHPLYARGYTSIGCDPCTRAVVAGEDQRAGRWWWESDTAKECGLNFSADGKAERSVDVLLRDLFGPGDRVGA